MQFLVQTGEARVLTGDLTSIIRQQRHTGTRVIIATQEPTLSPDLIDLCNATFVHRFLSPMWYEVLKKHLAAARDQEYRASGSLLETIVTLRTGEALLFCPTAQLDLPVPGESTAVFTPLGNRYAKVQIRKRTTIDGGRGIAAMESGLNVQNVCDVDVPMYLVPQVKKQKTTMHQPMMQQPSIQQPTMQQNTKKQVEKKQTKLNFGANETEKAVLSMPAGLTADRVKKVARRLAKKKWVLGGWGWLKNLDPEQRDQLYYEAEGNLSVNNGDISDTVELRTAFDKEYDATMVSDDRHHYIHQPYFVRSITNICPPEAPQSISFRIFPHSMIHIRKHATQARGEVAWGVGGSGANSYRKDAIICMTWLSSLSNSLHQSSLSMQYMVSDSLFDWLRLAWKFGQRPLTTKFLVLYPRILPWELSHQQILVFEFAAR